VFISIVIVNYYSSILL